ncbi:Mov34/MPN/PAD-1 family protein [Methanosarcina mazei]|nr:Mov34/MPN/PAD-1 family protein [Methanosarcina mazei]
MFTILISEKLTSRLISELKESNGREIGGLLMGEYVYENVFRISHLTVQREGGDINCFVRQMGDKAKEELELFFEEFDHDYEKYNYLGEWHSHPSFPLIPSKKDQSTMWEIVNDPEVGALFVVLLIVKLNNENLKGGVNAFVPGFPIFQGKLVEEK